MVLFDISKIDIDFMHGKLNSSYLLVFLKSSKTGFLLKLVNIVFVEISKCKEKMQIFHTNFFFLN